jgi:alpha-1,6-mannosyltransferase
VPIKTLHLTNAYHPASGGIRTFYNAMLEAANRDQRLMRLVIPDEHTWVEEVGAFGRIYHVKAPRSPFIDTRYRVILPHEYITRTGVVRGILRRERPDLVEICDKYSLCHLGGLLRRAWIGDVPRPTIVSLSCERLDDNIAPPGLAPPMARRFARWYMGQIYAGQFDVHLANSEYTARELREGVRRKHWREVHVVPMGVGLDDLGPHQKSSSLIAEIARRTGLSSPVVLLYAGRLAREKNLSLLIEMMEALASGGDRRAVLVVAGSGPVETALREDAERRVPGGTLFWGHVQERPLLARLYASADVFVHPNPREPFGIGPLEAMASGTPLVAPEAGGLLSYANRRNAWLVPADGQAFAEAVRRILDRPDERARKVAEALRTVEAFSWSSVTRVIFALYDHLHARRMASGPTTFTTSHCRRGRRWPAIDPRPHFPRHYRPISPVML